jgi:hypothetical protein
LIRYASSSLEQAEGRRRLTAGHRIVSFRHWLKCPVDVEKTGKRWLGKGVDGIFFLLLLYDYHGICGNEWWAVDQNIMTLEEPVL